MKDVKTLLAEQRKLTDMQVDQLCETLKAYPFYITMEAVRRLVCGLEDAFVNEREERGMQEAYAADLAKQLKVKRKK